MSDISGKVIGGALFSSLIMTKCFYIKLTNYCSNRYSFDIREVIDGKIHFRMKQDYGFRKYVVSETHFENFNCGVKPHL